jgi:hypothetical protein
MPINFATRVYKPNFDVFARPVTFNPVAGSSFDGRGIYSSQPLDVLAEGGGDFSDNETILDIIDIEFATVPAQNDQLTIPAVNDLPALGDYVVVDTRANGGGETSLVIRKLVSTKP